MFKIDTMQGHERMSTQDLLLKIEAAVRAGETDFDIKASGQHDIGGPLWHPQGKKLKFHVTNAGQRVGSMALPGTEILVEESASADVGWLNAGGIITVRGDAGDTAGHCSSGGKIFIGGRGGTRTGSLMKHDPVYEEPELWILKNVGSFSFEFMGGGKAVVCGYDCADFPSVLGERPCVGMVGGTVYVRGPVPALPKDMVSTELAQEDIDFLSGGMQDFLLRVGHEDLLAELSEWSEWKKLRPLTFEEKTTNAPKKQSMQDFRLHDWVKGGIFADVCHDDFEVHNTLSTGLYRLRIPSWDNAKFAAPCEFSCPTGIPTQQRYNLIRQGKLDEAFQLELKYTPFPGSVCGSVCPNPCMEGCTRGTIDTPIQIGDLGYKSAFLPAPKAAEATGKKVAVVGGGVAGLSAAWQLALKGHSVTVYDEAERMGGKLEQVIPRGRLSHELLEAELKRIQSLGVEFVTSCKVDKEKFAQLRNENDAVVVAAGGTKSRFFPWEGKELLTMGLEYLKAINRGEKPLTGKRVVVIGAGNSGMDTCRGAYEMGAESVVAVDVQKPAAFKEEIDYIEGLGGKLVWPFFTEKITKEGVYGKGGQFIPADQVIVSIGEEPELDFLPENEGIEFFRGSWVVPKADMSLAKGVFTAGDTIKPGRLTDAIGSGRKAAWYVDQYLAGSETVPFPEKAKIPAERLSKAYFDKCHHCALGDAAEDHARCVSCGTCRDCKMCLESCPEKAITRVEKEDGSWEYVSDPEKCIGCGVCAGVCPCGVWSIEDNPEEIKMYSTGAGA
ncbi:MULTISPECIES: FAD-dependent oxidoreductase [unclassified Selenomonas]|uniref:FAD-dependent oxidoreductase n=1 Tax=unclassified Selenomonas TaxID=2637378 RepID=UPI000495406B|nr:glutamate synthase (NADPH) GltB3 subunit [Selenomonas ruminantium]